MKAARRQKAPAARVVNTTHHRRLSLPDAAPGTVHAAFEEALTSAFDATQLLTDLIASALAEAGVPLTDAGRRSILQQLQLRAGDELQIEIDDANLSAVSREQIVVRVSEVLASMGDRVDRFTKRATADIVREMPRLIDDVTTNLANHWLRMMAHRRARALRYQRFQREEFALELRDDWGFALDSLEFLIYGSQELAIQALQEDQRRKIARGKRLNFVLRRLHARGCQIASEILVLLANGFADGAHARWRSLHEVNAVAWVIAAAGERTALAYVRHDVIQRLRGARSHIKAWPKLSQDVAFVKNLNELTKLHQAAIAKYGGVFEGDFGWAAKFLRRTRKAPTFADIEEAAKFEMLRPHYGLANLNVHAGSLAMTVRLGLALGDEDVILAGSSSAGLGDPGALTALSLKQLGTIAFSTHATVDGLARAKVLRVLGDRAISRFDAAARRFDDGAS